TASSGAFTYTPTSGFTGSDSFTFNANDGTSNSNTASVALSVNAVPVQYAAPVASGESLTTYAGQTLSGQLSAVASNGHALTYTAVAQPAHGTLTLTASSGAFTYTPTSGFTGSDSFTFNANDGTSNSNTASVALSVKAVPVTQAPATTGGSGGGGALGILSLILLAGFASQRNRH
ncbi:MAG: Ig-like domain-containing protein, partial [Gammaproteobacteria bacterium]